MTTLVKTNLDAALGYLRRGWASTPLCWPTPRGNCGCGRSHIGKDIGKAPLLSEGYQNLRPTEKDIRQCWTQWPQANVGILLEPSGLLVVDLDGSEAQAEAQRLGLPPGPVGEIVLAYPYRNRPTVYHVSVPPAVLEYARAQGARLWVVRLDKQRLCYGLPLNEVERVGWTKRSDGQEEFYVPLSRFRPLAWQDWPFVEQTLDLTNTKPKSHIRQRPLFEVTP